MPASKAAIAGYIVHCAAAIASAVYINGVASFTLSEFARLQGPSVASGVGNLVLADELLALGFVLIWGSAIDRAGFRLVATLSHVLIALAFVATAMSHSFGGILFSRLIFSLGLSAAITSLTAILGALSADEPSKAGTTEEATPLIDSTPVSRRSSSSLLSGLVGISTGVGALFGVFVLVRLPNTIGLRKTYLVVSIIEVLAAIVIATVLRIQVQPPPTISRLRAIARGFRLARQDGEVALACLSGFATRSGTIIVVAFVPVLVNAYFLRTGLCTLPGPDAPPDQVKESCRAAFSLTSAIVGTMQTLNLIGAPLAGLLGHARPASRVLGLMIAYSLAVLGFILMAALPDGDPRRLAFVLPAASLLGLAQAGGLTIGLTLTADARNRLRRSNADEGEIAGSLAGVYSMSGGLGILIIGKLAGLLASNASPLAPFVLQAVVSAIALLGCVAFAAVQERK